MKQRIYPMLEKSLYASAVLLISLLVHQPHSIARQVNGNVISQQNSSLPLMSERANGVNSRYLSAASTASLAAATVAAANAAPQNVNQDSNRNFLIHQQQQQLQQQQLQQQQQQSVTGNSVNQVNQPQQSPAPATQQVTPNQVSNTPVVSTTFTYNPLTGQFVPSEISSGSFLSGYNQFVPQPVQQQQTWNSLLMNPPFQSQVGPLSVSSANSYFQPPQRLNPIQQQSLNGINFPYNNNINQQRQNANQFSRRNGYVGPSVSSARVSGIYGQQLGIQPVEDDSGFFQQQVANTGGLINGISSESINSFGVDSVYGNLPGNSYLINTNHHHVSSQQQQQQQQPFAIDHQISSPSSSVFSTVQATPTTSFNVAFTGSPTTDYKNDQCVAADNRHGTCYQASECIKKGGTPMGKCGTSSNEFSGSSYVCCLFDITCGQFAAERFVYFRNPNYPNTYDQSRMCRAKIGKLDKGVCQFRLDLLRFDVAKPTNGNCSNDMFVVSGQNENYIIPKICGLNDGQHYYVGVDESGVITLHMMMMGFFRRSFEILITQIPCRSDYAAPAHCLQYYMGTHGTIKSFNYDDQLQQQSSSGYDLLPQGNQADSSQVSLQVTGNPTAPYGLQFNGQLQQRQNYVSSRYNLYGQQQQYGAGDQFGGYPNDLDYTMCVRKESGFCSITYQLSRSEQGLQPFAVGYSFFGSNDSSSISGHSQGGNWNPVSTECRDDYLLIGGVRLCSGSRYPSDSSLYDGGASIQFAQNGSILNSAGIHHSIGNQLSLQQQQLQNQHNLLLQQLARIQQQIQLQQQQQVTGNGSYLNGVIGNNNSASSNLLGGHQQQQAGNINNLEQQQAAIVQQVMLIQQQMNLLSSPSYNSKYQPDGQYSDLHGAIITDTTPGPFILRFVSNMARNARGFQIDYRQNPCK